MTNRANRIPIERIVLGVVGALSIIALIAVAPGVGLILKTLGARPRLYDSKYIANTISRLNARGYIAFEERNGKKHLRITEAGKKKLRQYQQKHLLEKNRPVTPKHWDGKWRIVTFDIPEKSRKIRGYLRHELSQVGFVQLHKSVWVYPYDCEEFVALLKADIRIGKGVLYAVAEKLEYDKPLRSLFKL